MTKEFALITGASAGIGLAFARALAERRKPLVLVARREAALTALADELRGAHGVPVEVLPADLASLTAPEALATALADRGLAVDMLINNAGFGLWGEFESMAPERIQQLLVLNVVALTDLTRRLLSPMRAAGRGAIVNVASVAAFQAVPYFAVYAASKAYVLNFSEALDEELRGSGVQVQALCPGTTRTEFFEVAGVPPEARSAYMTPEAVVAASLAGLDRGAPVVVPGFGNTVAARGGRCLPRGVLTRIAGRMMRPAGGDQGVSS